MPKRRVYVRIHIDTNRINARQSLVEMNQLERWRDDEVIELFMSEVAHNEARAGDNPQRARKALDSIYSITMANTHGEQTVLRQIETILAGGGVNFNQNTKNDAEIVFNAKKYMAILVTADGGILDRKIELSQLNVRVMTDQEAVEDVRAKIAERDELVRSIAAATGLAVPQWVGQD